MGVPNIPQTQLLIQAGIDPKTGLPIKVSYGEFPDIKGAIKKNFRILDEQDAINRYVWYNLPSGLNGQLIERILYYKGQAILFYMPTDEKFYFLPYALEGTIDVYGRYTGVTPLPFAGGTTDTKGKPKAWIQGLKRVPQYDIVLPQDLTLDMFENSCVILKDYSEQLSSGSIIPRQELQEGLLDVMSDCVPFMRTALLASTGIDGIRVTSEDEQQNVTYASRAVNNAALTGDKWIPIVGGIDFQSLSNNATGKAEEFLLALQSLDNLRLSLYGLDHGGVFQKRSQVLQAEERVNSVNTGLVLQDGLKIRQRFCNIVNSIWGIGTWVDVSETISNADTDQNGVLYDVDKSQAPTPQESAPMEVETDE